jgi:hypothetical protein
MFFITRVQEMYICTQSSHPRYKERGCEFLILCDNNIAWKIYTHGNLFLDPLGTHNILLSKGLGSMHHLLIYTCPSSHYNMQPILGFQF